MNGAFYIGATGLDAEQRALDIVANNIANINTTGFKRSAAQFSALMAGSADSTNRSGDSSTPSSSTPSMLGVGMDTSPVDFAAGQLAQTSQAMDIAISGNGFLELLGPGGQTLLWRGGSMQINSDGYLAAPNGMPLKSMISVPVGANTLTINASGAVLSTSGATTKVIGQIDIVQDKDLTTLTPLTGGVYQPANTHDLISSPPGEDGAGTLAQGMIEASNVNLSTEMVSLLMLQRAYSANAQVVQAGDQLMAIANSLRR